MAVNMEILSQRDDRWKDKKLGSGDTTIGSHGCTVTAVAMLAGLNPDEVNERLKSVSGFTGENGNLVIWKKIDEAIPWLQFEWRGYAYDNDKVKANIPCLVEVDGKRIGASKHWVLYIGNQTMHDPWFGTAKGTSYYPPTGFAVIKKIGDKPQNTSMSDLQEKYDHLKIEYEAEQQRLVDCRKEKEVLEGKVKSLENQLEEEDNALVTFIRTLANNLGTTQNTNEIIAAVRTTVENHETVQKSLKTLQNEVAKFIKDCSEATDMPLVSLEAVLGAVKTLSQGGNNTDIDIVKPVFARLWEFVKNLLRKLVNK